MCKRGPSSALLHCVPEKETDMTQALVTSAAVRATKHATRMLRQSSIEHSVKLVAVPRGTARNLRRAPLQALYAKRVALGLAA